jgi:hypothetical protein
MKRQLQTRQAHLNQLHETIRDVFDRSMKSFDQTIRRQKDQKLSNPPLKDIPFFRRIHGQVSHWALKRIYQEYDKAKQIWDRDHSGVTMSSCTMTLGPQYGLPCQHTIFGLLQTASELELYHIDAHWWLDRENLLTDDQINRRNEPDPQVIPVPRRYCNRNGGGLQTLFSTPAILEYTFFNSTPGQNSMQREVSHDEIGGQIIERFAAGRVPPARST